MDNQDSPTPDSTGIAEHGALPPTAHVATRRAESAQGSKVDRPGQRSGLTTSIERRFSIFSTPDTVGD